MAGELAQMKHRMVWSFVFLIPLFYISMGHMMGAPLPGFLTGMDNALAFAFTQLLLTLPIMYLNDKYYKVGFKTLFHGAPNMDSLIAVGSMAAVAYGVFAIYQIGFGLGHGDGELVAKYHMDLYFESAGMILTLITLGKFLETRSKGKTSQAITRLMDLAPKTARVLREGGEMEIPVEEVLVGEEAARYSRCDQNRHLNNTRYADLICDHLPLERLEAGPVRELTISYHREAPLGCTLGLYAWEEEPGRYYFLGKNGEQSCFEAAVKF